MSLNHSIFTLSTTQVLGVHVQYLPELHPNLSLWIVTVFSILDILIGSSSLKCFIISLSTTIESFSSSQPITVSLRKRFPTWVVSIDTTITSKYSDNIYISRIAFRGTCTLSLLSPLAPSNSHSSPIPHQCYLSQYNFIYFSIFTTPCWFISPTSPIIYCFATPTEAATIGSNLEIIDMDPPPLESQLHPSSFTFDEWFEVPFLYGDTIIHVRSPRISEFF